jgi:hypothetical protein
MSPAEDAALLLAIVRRHLFAVEARYEEEPFPCWLRGWTF